MLGRSLDFYFDFISPFGYLAGLRSTTWRSAINAMADSRRHKLNCGAFSILRSATGAHDGKGYPPIYQFFSRINACRPTGKTITASPARIKSMPT